MLNITVEIPKSTYDMLKAYPKEAQKAVIRGLSKAVRDEERQAKKRFNKPGQLKVKTGRLRASITSASSGLQGWVGSDVNYAAIHQYGGIIKPKTGKYLIFKGHNGWSKVKKVVIPARPFILPDEGRIQNIIVEEIVDTLNGA